MKLNYFFALILTGMLGSLQPVCGQHRFSVSVSAAPVYAQTDLKVIGPVTTPGSQPIDIVEHAHGVGYSIGLLGHYNFTPKWSASAGLWATQTVSSTIDLSTNGVDYTVNYANSRPFNYAYKAPVMINFRSSMKRLSPYFSAGASADFRATSYATINGTEVPLKFGKTVTFTPLLGAGIIYGLSDRLSLLAQPMLQYNLDSHPSYSYYHSYQLSLQMQLKYQL
ncbi:hypothetical protein WBJ53_09025 [Spirosoma sp. SC4-14]|uniref:hypothetical protein n=1 Tax=Spirosoma sp. SC4-14 TaxID=3128900 RepID=UPI0030D534D6